MTRKVFAVDPDSVFYFRIPEIRSQETLLTDSAATLLPLLIQHTITTTTTPLLLGLRELLLLVDLVDLHHLDLPPGLLLPTLTIQVRVH